MFSSFDGTARRRRPINLGGDTHRSAGADIIKNALRERKIREDERRRTIAAIRIQSWFRSCKCCRTLHRQWRNEFEDLSTRQDATATNDMLRRFVLFCDPEKVPNEKLERDAEKLRILLQRLKDGQLSFLYRKLYLISLSFIGYDIDLDKAILKLFVSNTIITKESIPVDIWYSKFGRYYSTNGCIELSPAHVTKTLTMFLPEAYDVFVLHCLSRPQFFAQLKHGSVLAEALHALCFKSILLSCERLSISAWSKQGIYWVLAHILELQNTTYQEKSGFWDFIHLCQVLCIILSCLPSLASFDSLDPYIRRQLGYMTSRQFMRMLISAFDVKSALSISRLVISMFRHYDFCKSDLIMELVISSSRSELEFNDHTQLLIEIVRSSSLFIAASKSKQVSFCEILDTRFNTSWPPLIVLCEYYSRILLTMVDDDFFSKRSFAIDLHFIEELCNVLKNNLIVLYWPDADVLGDQQISDCSVDVNYITDLSTRLLQQIYMRNSRRMFLPHDFFWVTDVVDADQFIMAVISEDINNKITFGEPTSLFSTKRSNRINPYTPRLNVLRNVPFFIPFETRVAIFRKVIDLDKKALQESQWPYFVPRHRAELRRDHIFDDAFAKLHRLGKELKFPISISLIDIHGLPEAGIDGGGLTKEFLTSITAEAFGPNHGLFKENSKKMIFPNPHSHMIKEEQLACYEFLGRIIGKCIYEGILVDIAFAPFFLLKWLGKKCYLDDLQDLDPDLYQGLMFLERYSGDVENDLMLSFTVTDEEFGQTRTIELAPGGGSRPVTKENRLEYVHLISNYRLNTQLAKQSEAFARGLADIVEIRWLAMFNQQELRTLIGGSSTPIDIDDLRRNTVYGDYDENDTTIVLFWNVLKDFSEQDRRDFLRFATAAPRLPLLGASHLNPKFAIRRAGDDTSRLPTSSTCVSLLKLPPFQDYETMRDKLLMAIRSGAGFDLS